MPTMRVKILPHRDVFPQTVTSLIPRRENPCPSIQKHKRMIVDGNVRDIVYRKNSSWDAQFTLLETNGSLGMNGEGLFHDEDVIVFDRNGKAPYPNQILNHQFVWERFLDDDQLDRLYFDRNDTFGR